jgi:predicted MPP superfamily phosphohydrolase
MIIKFILFIGVLVTILFGAHFLLYIALVRSFTIANATLKTALFICLSFLSVSFVISFILIHWWENLLTSSFYIFSATWLGLFVNLCVAAGLGWLLMGIIRLVGYNPNPQSIVTVFLILAVLYSVYGIYSAFHPRIKHIEVDMENLPEEWKDKTIVQLSDVHLGLVHGIGFLERVVGKVNALNPELVFITGDLFDGMGGTFIRFVEPLNNLKARKGIFYITGNHETYIGIGRVLEILGKTKINILSNEVVELEGLQVIGISYPGLGGTKDIQSLKGFQENFSRDKPSILLFHTPTNIREEKGGNRHYDTYWVPDTSLAMNREIGVDLQLSGHTHSGQIFPFGYLTKLIYKGYDYGLHNEGSFSVYITSGVGTWGPPMRTGSPPEIVVIKLR